ncbi:hypothetical protein LINPERHAP1_LOCUS15357 [Linum perenne]
MYVKLSSKFLCLDAGGIKKRCYKVLHSRGFPRRNFKSQDTNKGSIDEKMEDFEFKNQKIDVEKIVGDDGSMHGDSTNPYNKFDDIVGKYNAKMSYAKGNVKNISDDISSLKILSQGNKNNQDIDDSESLIFRNDDYRSREDASIGLRRKSSLKVGPQHKSPYVNVSSVGSGRSRGRGRGRGRGGRHNNKRGRGGRKSKATTSDEKVIDIVVDGLSLSYNGFGDRSIWFMPWAFTNQVLQWFERPSTEQLIKQYKHLYKGDITLCKQLSALDDIVRHESFGSEENSDIPSYGLRSTSHAIYEILPNKHERYDDADSRFECAKGNSGLAIVTSK